MPNTLKMLANLKEGIVFKKLLLGRGHPLVFIMNFEITLNIVKSDLVWKIRITRKKK